MTVLEIPAHLLDEITEIVFGSPTAPPPSPCDLIFIFGGSHPGLWQTAAQAYHLGLGKTLLATGGCKPGVKHHYTWSDGDTPEAYVIRRELIKLGVSENDIVCEDRSTNTLENVLVAKDVLDFSVVASILAVCKNYGLGRGSAAHCDNRLTAAFRYSLTPSTPKPAAMGRGSPATPGWNTRKAGKWCWRN